jgi:altronate dehydratase
LKPVSKEWDKPVESVVIQEAGDTLKAIEQGARIAQRMVAEAAKQQKKLYRFQNSALVLNAGERMLLPESLQIPL